MSTQCRVWTIAAPVPRPARPGARPAALAALQTKASRGRHTAGRYGAARPLIGGGYVRRRPRRRRRCCESTNGIDTLRPPRPAGRPARPGAPRRR
ncbi:hypothetical protein EVAR_22887_1 [Eumeta japonica]|uniref:Uncharacterized protein n=1 Tax=Eumeta variegata TaxID=151549 RepID=A0A4C1UVE5_EUMVA|nr:hypothetical protein EVAR_22887_1 [Eumeta japonica]